MVENEQVVLKRTEKANSYEFGKAANRFKLYFETPSDLKKMIDELKEQGFIVEDGN